MFSRTLASPVLNLGQFVASHTVVAGETRVSRELKKPRLAPGGEFALTHSRHNNGEAAFCQMMPSAGDAKRRNRLPSRIGHHFPKSADGG